LFAPAPRTFHRTAYRPARSASSTSGSPAPKSRSATARPGSGSSSSRVWGSHGPRPGCWCLAPRRRTWWPARRLLGGPRRAAQDAGLGPPRGHPRPQRPPERALRRGSAGSCGWAGGSASRPIHRPRAPSSACRVSRRPASSPDAPFPTTSDFQEQLTGGSPGSTAGSTRHSESVPRIDCSSSESGWRRCAQRCRTPRCAGSHESCRTRTRASTPTTTRCTRRWSAEESKSVSTAKSPRSRWTPGKVACRHARVFAKHRTVTALEHARALKAGRRPAEMAVEVRPLARYDALIA
jgi:hypothetical protein